MRRHKMSDIPAKIQAQEVELVMPEVVSELEGLKGVAVGMFMPMVVKAIQEIDTRLAQLEAQ